VPKGLIFVIIIIMTMDIETEYNSTIEKLKNNIRPHTLYTTEQGKFIKASLDQLLTEPLINEPEVNKVLCLLEHGQCHAIDFQEPLKTLLQKPLGQECLIFTISTSIKWIVEYNLKNGRPLSSDFIEIINQLLRNPDAEIREWVLRLIDSTGNQSFKFKNQILEIKKLVSPKFLRKSNPHNTNSYKIIIELEKRWDQILGSLK
jgi:hypothetical protein